MQCAGLCQLPARHGQRAHLRGSERPRCVCTLPCAHGERALRYAHSGLCLWAALVGCRMGRGGAPAVAAIKVMVPLHESSAQGASNLQGGAYLQVAVWNAPTLLYKRAGHLKRAHVCMWLT